MEYVILGNGIAGVCAAEMIRQFDSKGHITMVADETLTPYSRPMISMILDTGCVSVAHAKAGFKTVEALEQAGPGLKEVCGALGIPPVLHVGSCVDNVRILVLVAALSNTLGCDISDLPVAGSAPEWYSEKAATIGCYFVASGVFTHLVPCRRSPEV